MATTSICTSCLRALRVEVRKELHFNASFRVGQTISASTTRRTFTSLRSLRAEEQTTASTGPNRSPAPPSASTIKNFAASVRQNPALRSTTEPYVAYGTTETLFAECTRQISYTIPAVLKTPPEPSPKSATGEDLGEGEGWWYTPKENGGLGLAVTFNTWAQITFLHMYMLTARLRAFPEKHARIWHQQLVDHFFYAAEDRMAVWHGMEVRSTRNKYLKDLWQQWRGILLSYDEGVIKGDAVLAAAVWRNVFKADVEVDIGDLALVTAYVRREMIMLDGLSDQQIGGGEVEFGDPAQLRRLVEKDSTWMGREFEVEGEDVKEVAEGTTKV